MKKLIPIGSLLILCVYSLAAQQRREEGVAICYYEEGANGEFATHKTYPFGTRVLLINPVNRAQVTVQIGGRPSQITNAMVEISEKTAEQLGFPPGYPQWVWLEAEAPPAQAKHVMRPRMGVFRQSGNAIALSTGNDMTASHTSLPMGTRLKITAAGGDSRNIVVTINNRIRASKDRIIEISRAAAQSLGIRNSAPVSIETTN